jgi:NADH-quinone oxidoreductase subunit I
MRQYFSNIYQTVRTILIGLGVTLKYCFAKTVTVQYPDVAPVLQPRYRGYHYYEVEKCIACDQCARICPVECIHIEKSAPRRLDKNTGLAGGGLMLRYAIEYSKCLFCRLCVEVCPTDCIHMGDIHDMSAYDRASTVVEFTELAKQGLRTPQPLWLTKDRLPAWARQRKQQWLQRAEPARAVMLRAVLGGEQADQKPGETVGATPGATTPDRKNQ